VTIVTGPWDLRNQEDPDDLFLETMSQAPQAGSSNASSIATYAPQMRVTKEPYTNPLVAKGDDWTRSLVQLAKTAELK